MLKIIKFHKKISRRIKIEINKLNPELEKNTLVITSNQK